MKIIDCKENGKKIEPRKEDFPALERMHQKALKVDLTWQFFGGTLIVNNRCYQVIEG